MNSKKLHNMFRIQLLMILGLAALMPPAYAVEYWLKTGANTMTMPGTNEEVAIWGFTSCDSTFTACDPISAPGGPALNVPSGEGLTIHLQNTLPEATSIVIPGQTAAMTPVKFADGQARQRVRSFTQETNANGGTADYSWPSLRPGTYLYHSGTHPQVQVQMGLYGGIKSNAATGQAYTNIPYDSEVMLLYSEIDPVLHAAVATGRYGQPVPNPLPPGLTAVDYPSSTINYAPKYFLVNGKPFETSDQALTGAGAGQRTLLRFLNAGLQTHVPVTQGLDMQLVAEDGKPYPYAKNVYSAFLPAGKTVDAIVAPAPGQEGTYAVYDRKLGLSSGILPGSGMLAYLSIGAPAAGVPSAVNDTYAATEDTLLNVAASGVLGNDNPATGLTASLVSSTSNGTLALAADGSFTYQPAPNYSGADIFTYKASNGSVSSNVATVTITVAPANDPPAAGNDSYSMTQGGTLTVAAPGLLGNDSDPDTGNTLTAVNFGAATNGTVNGNADGGFSYTPAANFTGTATFTYQAQDNSGVTSNAATVSITVNPNQAPLAVDDTANTTRNVAVTVNVVANDSDPDGTIAANTVTIVTRPNKGGTVAVNANGTVTYTPKLNFRGTDVFTYNVKDNLGKVSNTATVRVNVTR
jgi:hypothetical protein